MTMFLRPVAFTQRRNFKFVRLAPEVPYEHKKCQGALALVRR